MLSLAVALLSDLVGDLSQATLVQWVGIIKQYEEYAVDKMGTDVRFFVRSYVCVGMGSKEYGHTIGVYGVCPRDGSKSIPLTYGDKQDIVTRHGYISTTPISNGGEYVHYGEEY